MGTTPGHVQQKAKKGQHHRRAVYQEGQNYLHYMLHGRTYACTRLQGWPYLMRHRTPKPAPHGQGNKAQRLPHKVQHLDWDKGGARPVPPAAYWHSLARSTTTTTAAATSRCITARPAIACSSSSSSSRRSSSTICCTQFNVPFKVHEHCMVQAVSQ